MKKYYFLILMISISFNYAFAEEQSDSVFDYSEAITAIIVAPVGGLVGYILKRHFVNSDFKFQQKVEHQHWLLQQFNPLVSEYYVPIAKFAFDASTNIFRAHSSKNPQAIKNGYYHTCLFISKYVSFKNNKGANFLFKDREYEQEAIIAIRATLASLPFDDQDIIIIHKQITDTKTIFEDVNYSGSVFDKFSNWVLSDHCDRSINLVIKKLDYLQRILDQGGEDISHPELIDKSKSILSINAKDDDVFFILFVSTKVANCGDTIQVYGGGFIHDRVKYDLYVGNQKITNRNIPNNDLAEFVIPNNIDSGIYDIYAQFMVKRWGKEDHEETIGIPIQIL